jgi:signal transduction histidine kinase
MAQIMGTGELDPTQTERLKVIRRSGKVLLSILNDILDLSKIEAGKLTIDKTEFDLQEFYTQLFIAIARSPRRKS